MSREYATSRVKDALEQADGNHLKAYRIIIDWLKNDHSLLVGIAEPHLKSIVTHAISHVDQKPIQDEAKQEITGDKGDPIGEALVEGLTVGSNAAKFGEKTPEGTPKPQKASQSHIDAMKQIAEASKDKKD